MTTPPVWLVAETSAGVTVLGMSTLPVPDPVVVPANVTVNEPGSSGQGVGARREPVGEAGQDDLRAGRPVPMALSVTVVPDWLVAVTGTLVPAELAYEAFPLTTASVPLYV